MAHAQSATTSHSAETVLEEQATSLETSPDITIWVADAPMHLVVEQLAQMSGRKLQFEGVLDIAVSGRFSGTLAGTLSTLSSAYPVLFDLTDESLLAVSSDAQSSVSIALAGSTLQDFYQSELAGSVLPGNKLEFREDAVHVSGHPAFVKRTARRITETLADAGARVKSEANDSVAGTDGIAGADVTASGDAAVVTTDVDQSPAVATAAADASVEPVVGAAQVVDSGADAMLADIEDEARPPAEQATLSRPIRWVTDIPGYHTF